MAVDPITDRGHADKGWDDYAERVLRNEGRLEGLENLVRETRASDMKLVEQRSESLADELTRTAEGLSKLMEEQRAADLNENRLMLAAHIEGVAALREADARYVETSIRKNYEQSAAALAAQEERSVARWRGMEQEVSLWRASDKEARELATAETARRLDSLNHSHERMVEFQNKSVTRELYDAGEKATAEKLRIIEQALLVMPTNAVNDIAFDAVNKRMEEMVKTLSAASAAQFAVCNDKIAELKANQIATTGRGAGMAQLYGWIVGGIGLLISVIVLVNILTGR